MTDFSRRALLAMAGTGLPAAALVGRSRAYAETEGSEEKGKAMHGELGQSPYHRDPVTFLVHRLGTSTVPGLPALANIPRAEVFAGSQTPVKSSAWGKTI